LFASVYSSWIEPEGAGKLLKLAQYKKDDSMLGAI
jgi:hypothetical protein